jgi:Rps23 Pro-64 3,4-dihydroxylase Tpa1-like proline 4-hydroxylase
MDFQLNPQLDLDLIARTYATDRRVRVNQLLPAEQAEALSHYLAEQTSYRHAFVLDGNFGEASDLELRSLPDDDRNRLLQGVLEQAARGVGFWYERRAINLDDQGLLGELIQWLNGEEMLSLMARLTGAENYRSAIAQATRFKTGDFLTRHQDVVTEEQRQVAYVVNLSPEWHPDWGGLLQFFQMDGTPRDAWSPDFNSLSLFDVSHVHSVTCVSPFAPAPRLAVSGWFRLR